MGILADFDQHRLDVEGRQDVAVSRVARYSEDHSVAGLERGERGKLESGRRTGRDDGLGGVDGDPVLRLVMAGDCLAQWRDAERIGITDPLASHRAADGLDGCLWR